jgi:hypothetical protein
MVSSRLAKHLTILSLFPLLFVIGLVNAFGQAGTLDTTFNTTGKQTTVFSSGGSAAAGVAIQPLDGKIVAAGAANGTFALARYNTDGTLDTAGFGTNGGGGGTVTTTILTGSEIHSVAIQNDGKIVAAGLALPNSLTDFGDFAIARYNTNGSLDTTFNPSGPVPGTLTLSLSASFDQINAVAIQSNGLIVVVGDVQDPVSGLSDFGVARFNSNGTLDSTFGNPSTPGIRITDLGDNDFTHAVAIQSNGSIVVAGSTTSGGLNVFALVRYTSTGALDGTFGSGGIVTTAFPSSLGDDEAFGVAVDTSGRIVAVGFTLTSTGPSTSSQDFALARYTSAGVLDSTFGSGGRVVTSVSAGADFANAVAIQSDGSIIAAGTSGSDFAVVRYSTAGGIDSGFGTGGVSLIDFGGVDSEGPGNSVALQSDGKIVVVGTTGTAGQPSTNRFAVARLIGGGAVTAANATVSGRVTTASGAGIQNVVVTLTDGRSGDTKQTKTKKHGEFSFNNVRLGGYTISVSARKYSFSDPTMFVNVRGDISDIIFIATN